GLSTLGDSSVLRYELIQPCPETPQTDREGHGGGQWYRTDRDGARRPPAAWPQCSPRPTRRTRSASLRRPPRDEPWRCGISPSTPRATGKAFPYESPQYYLRVLTGSARGVPLRGARRDAAAGNSGAAASHVPLPQPPPPA